MLRDEDLLLRLLGRCHSRSINVTWSNFPWAPMFPVGSCSMAVRKRRRLPGNAPSDGLENCWAGAARTRALQAPTPSRLGRDEDNGCVKGTAISRALPTRRIRLGPSANLGSAWLHSAHHQQRPASTARLPLANSPTASNTRPACSRQPLQCSVLATRRALSL